MTDEDLLEEYMEYDRETEFSKLVTFHTWLVDGIHHNYSNAEALAIIANTRHSGK